MKLPRNVSGDDLIKALARLEYLQTRKRGSHVRLTTSLNGTHHVTVPKHKSLRAGTLAAILKDVAEHFGLSREELIERLFS